jgi:hypothetical protein
MPDLTRKPRHRASTRGAVVGRFMGTSGAVAGAIVIAVGISGGSYALWVDSDSASAGTIATGSASLSITQNVNASLWGNLLAGESVRQQFTVTNTGTVPLALAGSATTGTTQVQVRLASGTCPGTALAGTSATVSPAALGTLAAGATKTVCLEVSLQAAAPIGTTAAIAVSLAGTQA